ncbi:hypothetical protein C8T65DRAFT_588230, partial [Cerioporus squamosus]
MDESERRRQTARLFIHFKNWIGSGDHSDVYHAPLSLEGGEGPRKTVAAKVAFGSCHSLDMLRNEASMYARFPKALTESTVESPAVVPKFYGLYMPLDPEHQVNVHRRECRALATGDKCSDEVDGAIQLMQACGMPLSEVANAECLEPYQSTLRTMMCRFHDAGFLHGSVFARNLLAQPGPLHLPPEQRRRDNPVFKLIDFGR